MSLASLLNEAATRLPNKPALCLEGRLLSYAELDAEVQRFASQLMACRAKPGDRIALHMRNGAEMAIAYFACFLVGAIAVPINTRMKGPEVRYVLEHSGTSIYVGQRDLFKELEQELGSSFPIIRQFLLDHPKLDSRSSCIPVPALPSVEADDPALILYTSGSTAPPKGVLHSHRSFLNAARGGGIAADDTILIVMSMAHTAALAMLIAGVDVCATSVVVKQFEADVALEAIARYRVTYMLGVPIMYRALIAAQCVRPRDVSSLKHCLGSGDTIPPALKSDFARHFGRPLHELFGTTETGLIAANRDAGAANLGSFGRALPGVEIAVDRSGDAVASEGEMIVRSAATMVRYWNDEAATAAALSDGWFRTGDMVHQDSDGYLRFRGRKKEVIVRGGSNVLPQEVETVLHLHDGVREAGVVGAVDSTWGERIVAFVSRRSGCGFTADELIAFVSKRLAAYKVPEEVVFVEDLPKNGTGKVDRRVLRERYPCLHRPINA